MWSSESAHQACVSAVLHSPNAGVCEGLYARMSEVALRAPGQVHRGGATGGQQDPPRSAETHLLRRTARPRNGAGSSRSVSAGLDARGDLKSAAPNAGREGSTPSPGTNKPNRVSPSWLKRRAGRLCYGWLAASASASSARAAAVSMTIGRSTSDESIATSIGGTPRSSR